MRRGLTATRHSGQFFIQIKRNALMSLVASIPFKLDESGRCIVSSCGGVDISAGPSAPSKEDIRLNLDFDGPPSLFGHLLAKLLKSLKEGVVVDGDVGIDLPPSGPIVS